MSRFHLAMRAEIDLAEIRRYVARENSDAATRLLDELFDLFHLLAKNPEIGQRRSELRPTLRSISHGQYVVFFYPMIGGVEIAGVVHGARDIDALYQSGQR